MHHIKSFLLAIVSVAAVLPAAAVTVEVSPGSLKSLITDEVRTATSLTLTGSMDSRDFATISDELTSLRELDLSAVSIAYYKPYRMQGMLKAEFEADVLPPGALLGMQLETLRLPSTLRGIGQAALAGNSFTTIEIPSTVTSIGADAFQGCISLTAVTVPAAVTSVGAGAWADCTALTDVSYGAAVVPASAFARCTALSKVAFTGALKQIGAGAFAGCSALKSVTLPGTLTSIGERAFVASGIKEIDIPASVTYAGDYAFALCKKLWRASFASLPEVGEGCFYHDPALQGVTFPDPGTGGIYFPDYIFTASTSLTFPEGLEGVTGLGRYALMGNGSTTLDLGASISHLDDGAMEGMTLLTLIDAHHLGASVPTLGTDVFAGIDQKNVKLLTAENMPTTLWENAEQWKEFNISKFVGITTPEAAMPEVKAWFAGSVLHVRAGQVIERLQVCDASGAALVTLSPGDAEAQVEMADFSAHVYIVAVHTATGSATFKLTR